MERIEEQQKEQLEQERQSKIEAIQDRPKSAKEVNLNKFPTTYSAAQYLESIGWKRGVFRASNYNPYQNLANLERILKLEAKKIERQLTRNEVEENFRKFLNVIHFLYEHVNYKKDPTIDEEIESKEFVIRRFNNPEITRMTNDEIDNLKKQKADGRVYSIKTEEKRNMAFGGLSLDEQKLAEEVIRDIEKTKTKSK